MNDDWPPQGLAVPMFDEEDLRAIGWEMGRASGGSMFAGCTVLKTGRCGDHFALAFTPGAYIKCRDDGTIDVNGVTFTGHGAAVHGPDCRGI